MNGNKEAGTTTEGRTTSQVGVERIVSFFQHLFGWHNSSCCVAGKWRMEDHKRVRHAFCTNTKLPLIKRNIVRLWKYLFVRRLAIDPHSLANNYEISVNIMIFEWQKMPDGYRWF
jgi:hypothetical protein